MLKLTSKSILPCFSYQNCLSTVSEITTAMIGGMGLSKLSTVIHPYPTQAGAIKQAADAYRRTLLTERTKKLLGFLYKLS